MVSLLVIEAVTRHDGVYVDSCSAADHQFAVIVELDGRHWLVYPHHDGSGRWVVALPTPLGDPDPGSELLLPLMPGEVFPCVWWTRFRQATDPLPDLAGNTNGSPPGRAVSCAWAPSQQDSDRHNRSESEGPCQLTW